MDHLGPSWGPLEAILGAILGPFQGFETTGKTMHGEEKEMTDEFSAICTARRRDTILWLVGAILGHSGPSWGHLGGVVGQLGAILGLSWGDLGAILGHSRASKGQEVARM